MAIGVSAGSSSQAFGAGNTQDGVAIGLFAGNALQDIDSVAIGSNAGLKHLLNPRQRQFHQALRWRAQFQKLFDR